jgi:uncharacterized protein YprB with RNaseH-like and TPR domain
VSKRLFFDLETTDLNANWGNILAIGYRVEKEPVTVLRINDFKGWTPYDDKRLIEEFLKVWSREDVGVVIGHNIILFDIPYLQARMLRNGLGVLPVKSRVDTYFVAKSKLKMKGKSLGSVAEFSGCKSRKTPLSPEVWRLAARGDEPSLEYIAKHCAADVRVVQQVYEKISPMMMRHPVIGDYGSCHVCGKNRLQKRGYATTVLRGKQIRYQCQVCGAWTTRPEPKGGVA